MVHGIWRPEGPAVPGHNDGTGLVFILTNGVDARRFYRGAVGTSPVIGE
jgi:hypothetical protein